GDEIARHRLSHDKGAVIKNRDHYRDKAQRIQTLETEITDQLGEDAGQRLCALLKQTNGNIYKDQLVGLKTLLKQFHISPALLRYLCDRSRLATSEIQDLLIIYQRHPERFGEGSLEQPGSPDKSTSDSLRQYAQIAEEAPYEHIH
ncbi:MAG: IS21 family transposase, partial [Candidatus Polarisedimenticolaceae bacterium]|nr:IS21 family transposase [Candidatus Polarisedimenticolaceae bacterium]